MPTAEAKRPSSSNSASTINPTTTAAKPAEPRKSDDRKSTADSDTSYDVVGAASGVPSQAPNSPKDAKKLDDSDGSDEEDWE